MKHSLQITMPDGSVWEVPVAAIARHRARAYAHEFGNNPDRSLREDTMPLFRNSPETITDWAVNNMNWRDVADFAVCIRNAPPLDLQAGWVNGAKVLV